MRTLSVLSFLIVLNYQSLGQVSNVKLVDLIKTNRFIFRANTAIPTADPALYQALSQLGTTGGSSTIPLNGSEYFLQINPDSLESFLPYYGRAYASFLAHENEGITFVSKKFSYKLNERKKGGWLILINARDTRQDYRMSLDISSSGYATLFVKDAYRQPIRFYGYISPIPDAGD